MKVLLLSTVLAINCPTAGISRKILDTNLEPFNPKPTYLQQVINYDPVVPYYQTLKETFGKLKNRGEAHITDITPPEFAVLNSKLSMNDINAIALANSIQSVPFNIVCLARQSPTNDNFVYNFIVDSQGLFDLRKAIELEFKKRGGTEFKAQDFYPHITLGFEQRDYFLEDGVVKNATTCICPVDVQ